MKVALIHCPFDHRTFSENIRVVDEEFCLAPPIILAYVAAILEKAGHEVIIVDANALKLSKEDALAVVRKFGPDMIGFRVDSYWFHRVVEWAEYFKGRLNARIIVGGINVSLYPRESLSYACFDYGISGEANGSLPKLLSCLERGLGLEGVEGLVYRSGGDLICNPPSRTAVDFDDYPFPARHLLPNHLYSSFTSQRKNFTIVLTSTGCPHGCYFCAIHRQSLRHRSARSVVDEIEECYTDHGIREVDFFSPSFFIEKPLAMGICDELIRRGIKVEWSCRSRVDSVDEECLNKAYRAGCRKIYYGIESASAEVLGNVSKDISLDQVRRAIELTRRARISTLGFFMVGNPGDTKESISATIQLAKDLKLDYVQVCRTIAKPNTPLNDYVVEKTGRDCWRDYILDQNKGAEFLTPWTGFSKEDLERYIARFYREFYFRPSYLVNRIRKIRSLEELGRYMRVAVLFLVKSLR